MSDDTSTQVQDRPERHRYEAVVDGAVAGFAQYREGPGEGVVTFTHTEVDDAFEGRGVGSDLVRGALDDVRARGLKVVALCPFVARYVQRHAEYQDLLAA